MKIIIIIRRTQDKSCIVSSPVFISHVESMKAVISSVYSSASIGISWVSSSGCILSFGARAPFGLRMEIYC